MHEFTHVFRKPVNSVNIPHSYWMCAGMEKKRMKCLGVDWMVSTTHFTGHIELPEDIRIQKRPEPMRDPPKSFSQWHMFQVTVVEESATHKSSPTNNTWSSQEWRVHVQVVCLIIEHNGWQVWDDTLWYQEPQHWSVPSHKVQPIVHY